MMSINSKYNLIPESLKRLLRKTSFYRKRLIRNRTIVKLRDVDTILNEAPALLFEKKIIKKPKVAIIKTQTSLDFDEYVNPKASWLRYERFCKKNDIHYEFYDVTKSDWLEKARYFDVFVCHTESDPSYQEMIESKIYILERILGKHCFPSFHEVWQYENKNRAHYLYQYYGMSSIPTLVTNSKDEAYDIVKRIKYPFISKTTIGSSSTGVEKVNTVQRAEKLISKSFGVNGLKTQYPYQNQKDYLYLQTFIDDATYDLRIMLVGNKAFGYYRYPNKGDFRASGAGNTEKKAIPYDALKLAIDARSKLNSRQMGVDLLFSQKYNQYYIIETSLFNQIDTPEQLVIDGVPGYYDITDVNNIVFKEGRFWVQELVLRDVINEWVDLYQNKKN